MKEFIHLMNAHHNTVESVFILVAIAATGMLISYLVSKIIVKILD